MTHHEFSPSSLQRVHDCPGSYRLCKQAPAPERSPEADEGTMLHERVVSGDLSGLDSEQTAAVESCLNFLKELKERREKEGKKLLQFFFEEPVTVQDKDGNIVTSGTVDVILIWDDGSADIIDWKFGRNLVIEAANNYQLAPYSLAVMQKFAVNPVTAHIYQPRLYHHSEYTFRNQANILSNIESIICKATAPELVLNPGESQCRYCPAKSICPAFSAAFSALAVESESRDLSNPAVLLDWWNKAQVVEKMVKELKDRVTDYCREHGSLGDWQLVERAGKREITNTVELCSRLDKLITASEWRSCNSVNLGKLTDLLVEKLKASASASGEKLTIKAAKEKVEALVGDLIVRGEPTSVLTRNGKK